MILDSWLLALFICSELLFVVWHFHNQPAEISTFFCTARKAATSIFAVGNFKVYIPSDIRNIQIQLRADLNLLRFKAILKCISFLKKSKVYRKTRHIFVLCQKGESVFLEFQFFSFEISRCSRFFFRVKKSNKQTTFVTKIRCRVFFPHYPL